MSGYDVSREFDAPLEHVWRALTEPELVAAWTVTVQSGRPVGFAPVVGTKFQFIGKPTPGWNGVVDCEVLAVEAPKLLRFTWRGGADDDLTTVECTLTPTARGTLLRWQHTGFTGVGGFIVSRILSSVRKKMFEQGLPPVLRGLVS
jgi:uncharacterized protein YndB with AHSA1/START domain